ncbi:MAG: hypothetical protein ABFS19_11675 [Thermodesulfobacteriota bacterium]
MSHTYLTDLYELIDQRLADIAAEQKEKSSLAGEVSFQKGRVDSLLKFKQFIAEHYNSKLPRRLRNRYSNT